VTISGSQTAADPSGTRYAISSVTVTNPSATASGEVSIRAEAFTVNTPDCRFISNEVAHADGPQLHVPPATTVHVTFPQPFVTAAVTGPQVCLGLSST